MQRRFILLKFLRTRALAGHDARCVAMKMATCNFLRFPRVKAQSVSGDGVTMRWIEMVHAQVILRRAEKEKGCRRVICGKLEILGNVRHF